MNLSFGLLTDFYFFFLDETIEWLVIRTVDETVSQELHGELVNV